MNLNVTVNEAAPSPPASTPGNYQVRARYTETDAGHIFGPFSTKETAEQCAVTLAARDGVINATVEVAQ